MKEKITYLILGILIGAVITAGCFLIFSKNQRKNIMNGERPGTFENMGEMKEKMKDGNFDFPGKKANTEENPVESDNTNVVTAE